MNVVSSHDETTHRHQHRQLIPSPRRDHRRGLPGACGCRRGDGFVERRAARHRKRHPRDPDPASVGDRRLLARVRGAAASGRGARRSLRPPRLADRRPCDLRRRIGGRDGSLVSHGADRPSRGARPRRGAGDAGDAVDDHGHVCAGGACACGQRLGRRRRRGRGPRVAGVRPAARGVLVAVDLRPERRPVGARARRHAAVRARIRRSRRSPARSSAARSSRWSRWSRSCSR